MESKQYFEMDLLEDFERIFQLNCGEYLMKYTREQRPIYGGVITIESYSDISVFVKVKLYSISNQRCMLTRSSILQSRQAVKLKLNLGAYLWGSGPVICSLKVTRYEEWQNFVDSDKKMTLTKGVTTTKSPITESRLWDLSSDMKRLLEQSEFSDVVLSDGAIDFNAHKAILSARSSSFSNMFRKLKIRKTSTNTEEGSRENRVTITDVPSEVLKELLTFIYTGIVTIKDKRMARDLYVAAVKYDLKELRDVCSMNLKDVDLDDVFDTLILAESHADKNLKQSVFDFVSENYSRVKGHEKWGSFMKENQPLALELCAVCCACYVQVVDINPSNSFNVVHSPIAANLIDIDSDIE